MKGAKAPMGDAGNLRDQRPSKVGMLSPRRPVVTHAWTTSCGPETQATSHGKRSSWNGNQHTFLTEPLFKLSIMN